MVDGTMSDVAVTWGKALSGIAGEQIATGLRSCVASGEAWPPTLPEFRAMCLGKKTGLNDHGLDFIPQYLRPAPIRDKSRLLSSMARDLSREDARQKLAEIKAMLR